MNDFNNDWRCLGTRGSSSSSPQGAPAAPPVRPGHPPAPPAAPPAGPGSLAARPVSAVKIMTKSLCPEGGHVTARAAPEGGHVTAAAAGQGAPAAPPVCPGQPLAPPAAPPVGPGALVPRPASTAAPSSAPVTGENRPLVSRIPRGARTKLLFSSGEITAEIASEMRCQLQSRYSPTTPGTTDIEEEIRTLPHVVRPPWDILRGEKYDMSLFRNRARHLRLRRRNRGNWDGPDCSSFSRAREIRRPGVFCRPLRTLEQPYGIFEGPGALSAQEIMDLESKTVMMQTSFTACKEDAMEGRAAFTEQPDESIAWAMREAVAFLEVEGVFDVLFDHCPYGGKRKKGTRVRCNVAEMQQLEWFCSGSHQGICDFTGLPHAAWFTPSTGRLHSEEEAEYPGDLCATIAYIWVLQGTFRRFTGDYLFGEVYSGRNAPLTRAMGRAWVILEERYASSFLRLPLPSAPPETSIRITANQGIIAGPIAVDRGTSTVLLRRLRDHRWPPQTRSYVSGAGQAIGLAGPEEEVFIRAPPDVYDLILFINRWLRRTNLLDVWTSLQINASTVSRRHRDKGNEGPSLILGLGPYEGGELVINNVPVNINNQALVFDGKHEHSSRPFSGERWTVVAYHHRYTGALPPSVAKQLEDLGFKASSSGPAWTRGTGEDQLLRVGARSNVLVRRPLMRPQSHPDAPSLFCSGPPAGLASSGDFLGNLTPFSGGAQRRNPGSLGGGLSEIPSQIYGPPSLPDPPLGPTPPVFDSGLVSSLSSRERRDLENSECIGGLRNPRFSQERVPGLVGAGRTLRGILDAFVDRQPPEFVEQLLSDQGEPMAEKVQEEASAFLASHLGCSARRGAVGSLRPDLAAAIGQLSGDPDVAIPRWMDTGAPLGITAEIPSHGIFPTIDRGAVIHEAHEFYTREAAGLIYKSAEEESAWVQEKLNAMVEDGSMGVYVDLDAACAALGNVVISKLACLVRQVPGSDELKRRLLVDMLRSGSNCLMVVPERGVLPRLVDAAGDARRLAYICGPGEFVELLVVDFSDAFFTMGVKEDEQRFQAVLGPDGRIYVFRVLGMGGASAPIIWSRTAAWVGRHTQAMYDSDAARLQIFVDDPFMAARGVRKVRLRLLALAIILWLALGLRLSWRKRQRGPSVQWIGAQLDITLETLTISIQGRFIEKMLAECRALLAMRVIPTKRMRSFAGGMCWIMTVLHWIRSWLSPLWAAIASSATWAGPPHKATIAIRQVAHSLTWLEAFLSGQRGSIIRQLAVNPRPAEDLVQVGCDASPWGLAAVLFINGIISDWIADIITEVDHFVLQTTAGCEGQSAFEALAILVAARHWLPAFRDVPVTLVVQSDSVAALGAAARLGSPVEKLNTIVRELALEMAEGEFEVSLYGHVPGHLNKLPDALSRLWDPNGAKEFPAELASIPGGQPDPRPLEWWRARARPTPA